MKFPSRDNGIPVLTEIIDAPLLTRVVTDASEVLDQPILETSIQQPQTSEAEVINQTEMLEQMYTRFEAVFGQQLQLLMTQAMQNAMDQAFAAVRLDIQQEQNRLISQLANSAKDDKN
ncbi:MAG: hypothetical protein ABI351_11945 [Herbaspirillum sp.]